MNNIDKLKDKKIKNLEAQLDLLQNKKIESDNQVMMMNDIIVGYQNRIAFFRSGIEKGLDVKEMFLDEVPFHMQVDYEIANYKHIYDQIKIKSKIVGWFAFRTIQRIIKNLEATKAEDIELREKIEKNKRKNLKIVK